MDSVLQQLETKLQEWQPETIEYVKRSILELIELADRDLLDISRSRRVEQEVLDAIDRL